MKRFAPAVRALCERVRRPTSIQMLFGLALVAPAFLINEGTNYMRASAPGSLPALVVDISKRPGPVVPPRLLGKPLVPTPVAQTPGTSVVEVPGAVAAQAVESTVEEASSFARQYGIPEKLADQIHNAATANGISPNTAFGLVKAESGFRSRAISPVGAVGLTQIMPATARWLKPGTSRGDLMNPSFNLNMGFRYLRRLIDDYNGNERLALTAFNRGPGTVNRLLRRGRDPDNGYADKVITGKSTRHVRLMNAKFGRRRS